MKHFYLKMIAMVVAMTAFVQANALDYSTASACLSNDYVQEWSGSGPKGKEDISTPLSDSLLKVCSGVHLGNQHISWCSWSFSDNGNEKSSAWTSYSQTMSSAGTYVVNHLQGTVGNEKMDSPLTTDAVQP